MKYFVSCLPGVFMHLAEKHKRERVSCDFVMRLGDFASGVLLSLKEGGSKVIGSSE